MGAHERKQEMSLFRTFAAESNESVDELAKDGEMLDGGEMAQTRASTVQQRREWFTRHCYARLAFTVWWKSGASVKSLTRSRKERAKKYHGMVCPFKKDKFPHSVHTLHTKQFQDWCLIPCERNLDKMARTGMDRLEVKPWPGKRRPRGRALITLLARRAAKVRARTFLVLFSSRTEGTPLLAASSMNLVETSVQCQDCG